MLDGENPVNHFHLIGYANVSVNQDKLYKNKGVMPIIGL